MSATLVILLVGSMVAASCALIGTFLVLRRMALLGDAISHAVLPGITIAFLLTGGRATLPMVIGAGALGVLTVFLVESLSRSRRVSEDTSIGVVFPALFSIGVILISRYAHDVDLDLDCVLYGEIAYSPWDVISIGGVPAGPKALWVSGGVLLMNLAIVVGLLKELKLSTFDAGLSATLGFSPLFLHYLLMSAVSVTVVGSFESVGAILVVAMLVVPPAAAYLLTDRLGTMLMISVGIGLLSAWGGYAAARALDASIAGAIAATAGLLFLLSFLLSPRHGMLARLVSQRRMRDRLSGQLLLLHLSERDLCQPGDVLRRRFGWSDPYFRKIIGGLEGDGLLAAAEEGLCLTEAGARSLREAGLEAVRHSG